MALSALAHLPTASAAVAVPAVQVPPPLGIGTVKLAAGGSVNGFICEGWVAGAPCSGGAGRGRLPLQPHRQQRPPPLGPSVLMLPPACLPTAPADACKAGAPNVEDITHLGGWVAYVERQAQRAAAAAAAGGSGSAPA